MKPRNVTPVIRVVFFLLLTSQIGFNANAQDSKNPMQSPDHTRSSTPKNIGNQNSNQRFLSSSKRPRNITFTYSPKRKAKELKITTVKSKERKSDKVSPGSRISGITEPQRIAGKKNRHPARIIKIKAKPIERISQPEKMRNRYKVKIGKAKPIDPEQAEKIGRPETGPQRLRLLEKYDMLDKKSGEGGRLSDQEK